jgi:hypothetical protein
MHRCRMHRSQHIPKTLRGYSSSVKLSILLIASKKHGIRSGQSNSHIHMSISATFRAIVCGLGTEAIALHPQSRERRTKTNAVSRLITELDGLHQGAGCKSLVNDGHSSEASRLLSVSAPSIDEEVKSCGAQGCGPCTLPTRMEHSQGIWRTRADMGASESGKCESMDRVRLCVGTICEADKL